MSSLQDTNLNLAKQQFLSLLSNLHPGECKYFLDWIIEQHVSFKSDHAASDALQDMQVNSLSNTFQECVYAEQNLKCIIQDLRRRLPSSGICASESMLIPKTGKNSDCDPATTVVIDGFLYDDDDIDDLCDKNQLSRNYCHDCGSRNITPLTFISHSMSVVQIKFIFQMILPKLISNFNNTRFVDVGSRLGAVLYGAYYFCSLEEIIGVEMNAELCHIQNEMVNKYELGNRIKIICNDICNIGELLQKADVILLNNTFEFFLPNESQISTWQNIRKYICKPGTIVISVPSVEESVCLGDEQKPILDVESWLVHLNVDPTQLGIDYSEEDVEELNNINFYKVK